MNKLLRDLTDGERTTIRVLLSSRSRGVTAKGAPYLSFVLQDKSGTMDAKYWTPMCWGCWIWRRCLRHSIRS